LNNVETSICPQQDGYGDVVFLSLGIPGIPRKKPKLHWCLKGPIGSVFVGKNSSASELFVGTPKTKGLQDVVDCVYLVMSSFRVALALSKMWICQAQGYPPK
jgi:hypothetical protein